MSEELTECPDCDSIVDVWQVEPGYFRGVVQHDESCPWLARLERDLS